MTDTGLLDPASVRRIAAELGLRPTKQRGQNFVIDANTVRRIVSLSGIGPDDVVLEIGPGLGSLTLGLLDVASEVSVIEIDERLAGRLETTVAQRLGRDAAARLNVVAADAMTVTELPGRPPTAVVAGGSRRSNLTSPESTFGTGQNTFGGTVPTRFAEAHHASFALGAP